MIFNLSCNWKHILIFSFLLNAFVVKAGEREWASFVASIMQLDFEKAHDIGQKINEGEGLPHFSLISQIISNSGQFPEVDKSIFETMVDKGGSGDALLDSLVSGALHLYNKPSNGKSFELLSSALSLSKSTEGHALLKLSYFLILELYGQEIVQTSEDYKRYIDEFGVLAKTKYELAWYHIHRVNYLVKSVNIEEVLKLYPKAIAEMEAHFLQSELPGRLMSYYLFNKAIYQRFNEDFVGARQSYSQVIQLSSIPFLKYLKFSSYIHLCHIESLLGNYVVAKHNLDEAKQHWNHSDSLRSEFIQSRYSSYWYYAQIQEYDSAFHLLLKSTQLERKMNYVENSMKISELNVKLETAKKENEILSQKNMLNAQVKWLWAFVILAVLLIALLIAIAFALRNIRAKNRKIEVLMRELHHRVKNNLQVISSLLGLQSMRLKDDLARKAVEEGKDRLIAMSLIHQKLYQTNEITGLNIKEYISNLVNGLSESYGYHEKVNISIEVPDIVLNADSSLPIGLIINELVTNAFKYAYKDVETPVLELKLLQESDSEFELSVKDNGAGLPQDFSLGQVNSFGIKLVSLLVRQLNGSLNIQNENGASFNINFQLI